MELHYPLEKHFPLTQAFGITPWSAAYRQYGLAGHNGVDFGCPAGTLVLAGDDGTVQCAGRDDGGYGLHVILKHNWGVTLYAHLEGLFVQASVSVKRGQPVVRSGSSGNSTGPHLHFEIRPDGEPLENGYNGAVDPLPFISESEPVDAPQAPLSGSTGAVSAEAGLNLRRTPSLDGQRLGLLFHGTSLLVTAEADAWRQVQVSGWVHGDYLMKRAAPSSAEAGGINGTD